MLARMQGAPQVCILLVGEMAFKFKHSIVYLEKGDRRQGGSYRETVGVRVIHESAQPEELGHRNTPERVKRHSLFQNLTSLLADRSLSFSCDIIRFDQPNEEMKTPLFPLVGFWKNCFVVHSVPARTRSKRL